MKINTQRPIIFLKETAIVALNNYLQDIAYSSEAFEKFPTRNRKMPTLVVLGDHLPSIYDENIQALNEGSPSPDRISNV